MSLRLSEKRREPCADTHCSAKGRLSGNATRLGLGQMAPGDTTVGSTPTYQVTLARHPP